MVILLMAMNDEHTDQCDGFYLAGTYCTDIYFIYLYRYICDISHETRLMFRALVEMYESPF